MRRRRPLVIAALAGGFVVLLAAAALWISPFGPGPSLPAGATRLHIATAAPHLVPNFACPAALLSPVRVATADDELIVVSVETGDTVKVVWPAGWAAWRLDGRAVLVAGDGSVVAREGDVIEDRFGGGSDDAGTIHICVFGW